jgi:methylmalonyl-CoA/ethylmalonyl-CoA epimerase
MTDMIPEPGVHLERIGQIAIQVIDFPRSKDFYENTLGMRHLFDAGQMAFFQCGEVRLMIGTGDKPVTPGAIILYFKVADIEAAYAQLEACGADVFSAPHLIAKMPDHDLWMAFLKDPDEHTIGLMCEKARAGD